MSIAGWLAGLGLERYAPAFEAAEIDLDTVRLLTEDDLREIGLPLGPRRKILAAQQEPDRPTEPETGAERRHLTVVFVDLVGSTNLSTRVDPEILKDLLTDYKASAAEEIAGAGGIVAKYLGDGILAYFGWPTAQENAPESAIRAAFAILARIKQMNDPDGSPLLCRIGIATGLVVVGGATGSGNAREDAIAGEVLNLAARLQALAEPDAICVSASVHALVGPLFEFEYAGEHDLKGFDQPIEAWRPLRESSRVNRIVDAQTIRTPLVGRDQELAALIGRWAEATEGDGRAVLILGEAGIGKSRLLKAIHSQIGETPHSFIGWQCSAFHQAKPLYPVIEHLKHAAGIAEGDAAQTQLAKLSVMLSDIDMAVESALPLLAAILSLRPDQGYTASPLSPAQRRAATIATLGEWIRRIAEQKPLLFVLEDAHWADATTLEVTTLLINAIGSMPMLAIVSGRPEFAAPWSGRSRVSIIGLDRLNNRQCEGLVRELAANALGVSDDTIQQIVARSDGNPLFLEELTATVLDPALAIRPSVPDTLQASLMARLDQLGDAKEIAQVCAVLGRRFARPLLARVMGMAPAIVDMSLSQLVAQDIIYPLGSASEGRYEFKHALVRDAAYESLLLAQRRRLHERCGRELESGFIETVRNEPELLAYHFARTDLSAEASAYFERAGDRAADAYSYIEAIANYRDALAQNARRQAGTEQDTRELTLLLKLGPALGIIDGAQHASVRDAYGRSETLARGLGDRESLFRAIWGLWYNANVSRDHDSAKSFSEELVALSTESGDEAQTLEALHCRWSSGFFRGEYGAAVIDAARGIQLYDREKHHRLGVVFGGHDPGVCACGVQACSLAFAGHLTEGSRVINDAIVLAENLDHPHSIAHALMTGLMVAAATQDYEVLRQWGVKLLALSQTFNFPPHRALSEFVIEWAKLGTAAGDVDFKRLKSAFETTIALAPMTLFYIVLYAERLANAGHQQEALSTIDEILGTLPFPAGIYMPEVYRIRAECLAAVGRNDEAREQIGQAYGLATEQGAELFRLRAAVANMRFAEGEPALKAAKARLAESLTSMEAESGWPEIARAKATLANGGHL